LRRADGVTAVWRMLNGANQLPHGIEAIPITDCVAQTDANQTRAT